MGVIKTTDHSLEIKSSVSVETLYIPSDDERGLSRPPSEDGRNFGPRNQRHNIPTVNTSFSGLGGHLGKKKSRRYHNVFQLVTLAEEDELQEVTIEDFVKSVKSPFSSLLEDEKSLKKWDEFVSQSEECQRNLINEGDACKRVSPPTPTRLNLALRSLVKKKNLPMGMLNHLEQEVVSFFSKMPTQVYVSPALDSFQRLLLHSVSDYHHLVSLSFNSESNQIRLVRVKNPRKEFAVPDVLLVKYLESTYKVV